MMSEYHPEIQLYCRKSSWCVFREKQRRYPDLSDKELETAKGDLKFVRDAVSRLHPGFVKHRLEAALEDIDHEFRQRQQQQQRQRLSVPSEDDNKTSTTRARPGEAAAVVTEARRGGDARWNATGSSTHGDPSIAAILDRAVRTRVTPSSALHAAALALHCLLLAEGFVCTGQDDEAGAVKGFAPPVRDVPEGRLVPDRWDADSVAVSFRYRRPDSPQKVYLFKTAYSAERGPTSFYLGERGGGILSADVDLEPLTLHGSNLMESYEFFEHLFSVFRREVLCRVLPQKKAPAAAAAVGNEAERPPPGDRDDHRQAQPAAVPQPLPSPGVVEDDPLREGPPRQGFAGPPGVGPTPFMPGRGGDFGGDLFPSVGGIGGGGGVMPGAGGLLGPNHPMFGGGGGSGYMEPRFDPYGPPMPGQPWGPGVPGRGAGRGGPSREGRRGPPGGPDNDHLPPPGGAGNMFF